MCSQKEVISWTGIIDCTLTEGCKQARRGRGNQFMDPRFTSKIILILRKWNPIDYDNSADEPRFCFANGQQLLKKDLVQRSEDWEQGFHHAELMYQRFLGRGRFTGNRCLSDTSIAAQMQPHCFPRDGCIQPSQEILIYLTTQHICGAEIQPLGLGQQA